MAQHFLRIYTIAVTRSGFQSFQMDSMNRRSQLYSVLRIKHFGAFRPIEMCSVVRCQFHPSDRWFINRPDDCYFILTQVLQIRGMGDLDVFLGKERESSQQTKEKEKVDLIHGIILSY